MKQQQQNISEEKTATASYIISFYQNVQLLTHYGANYKNLLVVLSNKYGSDIPDEEKSNLLNFCSQLRYYIYTCHVQANTIKARIGSDNNPAIEKTINKALDDLVLLSNDVNIIITYFHELLSAEIMKDLLNSSQQIIDGVFSE